MKKKFFRVYDLASLGEEIVISSNEIQFKMPAICIHRSQIKRLENMIIKFYLK